MIKLHRNQVKIAAFGFWVREPNAQHAHKLFKMKVSNCPCYKTFQLWFKQFRNQIFQFQDKPRSGRPATVVNKDNEFKIREIIAPQRNISVRKLSKITAIKRTSINRILVNKLRMKRLKPIKNPYKLTQKMMEVRAEWCENQLKIYSKPGSMDSIVTGDETYLYFDETDGGSEWRFEHEDTPRIPKLRRFTQRKRMFYLFFNRKGIVHVDFRPLNRAANAQNYKEQIQAVVKKFGKRSKITLHDDNAPIHCAKLMQSFYRRRKNIKRMTHPPYSPDLAPNDFWLIAKLERALSGKFIEDENELYEEVTKILTSIPAEDYARCFDEWLKRMQKCIDKKGDYFEKRSRCIKRKNN